MDYNKDERHKIFIDEKKIKSNEQLMNTKSHCLQNDKILMVCGIYFKKRHVLDIVKNGESLI